MLIVLGIGAWAFVKTKSEAAKREHEYQQELKSSEEANKSILAGITAGPSKARW